MKGVPTAVPNAHLIISEMRSCLLLLLVPLASGGLTTINIGSRSFYHYDRLDRPSKAAYPGRCKAGAEPTTVKVRMTLERFHSVNPKHGTFGLDGYLTADGQPLEGSWSGHYM